MGFWFCCLGHWSRSDSSSFCARRWAPPLPLRRGRDQGSHGGEEAAPTGLRSHSTWARAPLPGPTPSPQWRRPGSKSSFISEKSPCDSGGCFLAPNRQFHPLCPSQSVPDSWWLGLDRCGTSPSAHRHFFPVIPIETGGICIAPRPSEEGAEILPAMAMRPFFGIIPVLMDEKVCKGLPSSTHTPLSSLVFLPAFLASFAHAHAQGLAGGGRSLCPQQCALQAPRGHRRCSHRVGRAQFPAEALSRRAPRRARGPGQFLRGTLAIFLS